jgi:manganese/zinc/iron transport system permease protein
VSEWTHIDFWIVATAIVTALSCALLGNFLLVRRLSMMGDAIAHAVLPGIAIAFLASGSRDTAPILLGAAVAGMAVAVLTQLISHAGRVEESASMGVAFTTLFALGLVLIVRAADTVDLDPSCVLYGALELTPLDTLRAAGFEIPRAFLIGAAALALNACAIGLMYKEFLVGAFDPMLATSQGFHPRLLHQALMALTAITAVASFEAVGSILVVAMLVVPAATARLLTRRMPGMIAWSLVIAAASAALGHLGACAAPGWFGFRETSTSGMMAVVAGAWFGLALLFAPEQGVLALALRRIALRFRIGLEDALAAQYRQEEARPAYRAGPTEFWLRRLWHRGLAEPASSGWTLTARGRARAVEVIRSHRLWERYLVDEANVRPDQAHHASERLEHVTSLEMRDGLDDAMDRPARDPHGRVIPRKIDSDNADRSSGAAR